MNVREVDGTRLAPLDETILLQGSRDVPHAPAVLGARFNLQPFIVYEWRVRGLDRIDQPGPWSAPTRFAIVAEPGQGPQPRLVNLAYGPLAEIAWAPLGGQGTDKLGRATGYELKVDGPDGSSTFTLGDVSQWRGPLAPGDSSFSVRGINGAGAGAWSAPLTVTVAQPPGPPTLRWDTYGADKTPVSPLRWDAVRGASGYEVRFAGVVQTTEGLSYDVLGAGAGTHSIEVRSIGNLGPGPWSPPATLVLETAPVGPVILIGNSSVDRNSTDPDLDGRLIVDAPVTWEVPTGARWFEVEVASSAGFDSLVSTYKLTVPSFDPLDLAPGDYYLRVRAGNTGGWTLDSEPAFFTATRRPLAPPTWTTAPKAGGAMMPLAWTAVVGATGYELRFEGADGAALTKTTQATTFDERVDPGLYQVTVRGTVGGRPGPASSPLAVLVNAPPAAAPQLVAAVVKREVPGGDSGPLGNITWRGVPVTWAPLSDATSYEFQVSASSTFEVVLLSETLTAQSWSAEKLAGGEYYVRARGGNPGAAGPWSAPMAVFIESQSATPAAGLLAVLAAVGLAGLVLRRRPGLSP